MLKKILVPVDGSDASLHAIDFAMVISAQFGSVVDVVTVDVPYDLTKMPPRKPKNALEAAKLESEPKKYTVLEIAEAYGNKQGYSNLNFKKLVDTDPAEKIIAKVERDEYDMVVIGNRGIGGLQGFLLGSVSDKVAKACECPVVIVK